MSHSAVRNADARELERLLAAEGGEGDLSETDHAGNTALHLAVASGDAGTVGVLLAAGLPKTAFDRTSGESACDLARRLGHEAIAATLQSHRDLHRGA